LTNAIRLTTLLGNEVTTLRTNPPVTETLPFIRERVEAYLSCIPFSPDQALQLGTIMKDRRRARGGFVPDTIWASSQLREWISKPTSSILRIQGSLLRCEESRDIALDIIQLMKLTELPVIWYLSMSSNSLENSSMQISIIDIFRSLIQQTINQITEISASWDLNDRRFQLCKSAEDWLHLFVAVLGQIPRISIIIDAHQGVANMLDTIGQFWDNVVEQKITTVVKILVLTYETAGGGHFPVIAAKYGSNASQFTLGSRPGIRTTRILLRAGRRRRGTIRSTQSLGPEELKPFIQQLMNFDKSKVADEVEMISPR
jgi:hypothetical protein